MDKKFLKMRDGVELYVKIKESGSPVWIITTHGIGEHLERHNYIPEIFGHDFNIFQYDLRGHGRSSGRRFYVEDFALYMEDLKEIVQFLKEKYRMEKHVLFGHSMGALIHCAYMQNFVSDLTYPVRMIINAPPIGAEGLIGSLMKVLPQKVLSLACEIPFSYPIGGLVDLKYLSHDQRIKEDYISDELNGQKLETKLLLELLKTSQQTFSRPLRSKCPSFVTVGSADRVVGHQETIDYFTNVDKSFQLKVFDGAYHEIHNEIEKYRKPYFDHLKTIMNEALMRTT